MERVLSERRTSVELAAEETERRRRTPARSGSPVDAPPAFDGAPPVVAAIAGRIRRAPDTGVIRRVISDPAWDQAARAVGGKGIARLTRANGPAFLLRRNAQGVLQARKDLDGEKWAGINQQVINQIKANCDWDGKITESEGGDAIDFNNPAALTSNVPQGNAPVLMDVQNLAADPHSLVHYSTKTYKHTTKDKKVSTTTAHRGDHHLTVENAHLLLMDELAKNKTAAYIDKRNMDKPGIEKELGKRGMNPVDNLNFYPPAAQQGPTALPATQIAPGRLTEEPEHPGGAEVDQNLSLQQYLTFIQRALDSIADVPPAYGAKILVTATHMQTLTGWDPAQMFLRKGSGDHRHLTRAVMAMHHNGMVNGLVLEDETKWAFARYSRSEPELPATVVAEPTEWVAKASLAKDGTHYNELESRYVNAYSPKIIGAIRAFIGQPLPV